MALDPSFEHYSGLVTLGAYHARTAMAELDRLENQAQRLGGSGGLLELGC